MSFCKPDSYLHSLAQVSVDGLVATGVRAVLLDVDNTIVARGSAEVSPPALSWINAAVEAGLRVCLVSNNWHSTVLGHARALGLPIVYRAVKPLPFAFLAALRKLGARRRSSVVIGDQLVTDIFGAHLLGMRGILVLPLVERDLWHTLALRRVERLFLGGLRPEGDADASKSNIETERSVGDE
jgi:HAD superfamily phosphatase (TIGR01668 family)